MVKRKIAVIAFLLCFYFCLMPCCVQAVSTANATDSVSTDEECSLTISYFCDGTAVKDLPIKLYKIADVSADFEYNLTSSFASSDLIINGITNVDEWNVIRSTLESHIIANEIEADFIIKTNHSGQACFEALNTGLYLAITEQVIQNDVKYSFVPSLTSLPDVGKNGTLQYQVAVNAKPEIIPSSDEEIELKVLKLWKGDSAQTNRPDKVEIEIFRDGVSYQKVELSKNNNWSYSWKTKKDGSYWNVVERNIPSGYIMTVQSREDSFVVTNTFNQENPNLSSPLQTGDTSNILLYIILMNVAGALLLIIGFIGKRKRV